MRRLTSWKCILLFIISTLFVYIYYTKLNIEPNNFNNKSIHHDKKSLERIVLSIVVCDSRFNESLNVVKSALIFTKSPIYFVIFTDDVLRPKFNDTLNQWRTLTKNQLDFELQKIHFPEAHEEDWMNLFSKCAAQRLFIPKLVTHIDAMIYVDTDTLFLGPVNELWNYFSKFNSTQISAMTLEDDNPSVSWYPRFAKHPFYGKYGLNSGVMLMNLTRMRSFGWVDYVTPIMLKWKLYIPWGDQDIINIIFHYHESAVYVLSCRYNYRSDQCMYGDACADATARGVLLLHGSRQVFHNEKQPAFKIHVRMVMGFCNFCISYMVEYDHNHKGPHAFISAYISEAMYKAIDEHEVGTDPSKTLLNSMEKYFTEANVRPSNCGNLKDAFLQVPIKTLNDMYTVPER